MRICLLCFNSWQEFRTLRSHSTWWQFFYLNCKCLLASVTILSFGASLLLWVFLSFSFVGFSSLASSVNIRGFWALHTYSTHFWWWWGFMCSWASNTVSMMITFKSSSPTRVSLLGPSQGHHTLCVDAALPWKVILCVIRVIHWLGSTCSGRQ